jgi:hypothetical protein
MSSWPSAKARRVFAALKRFHDSEELRPAILAKIGKKTGLQPQDL